MQSNACNTSRIGSPCRAILVVFSLLLMLAVEVPSQVTPLQPDWVYGDVFVGTGAGNYQVWHSANPTANNPTYTRVQIINDGSSSATAGCGFDLGYRFFGTNFTSTLVDRYSIDAAHPLVEQIPTMSGASHSQSIAFDRTANLYIGYADVVSNGFGTIEQWAKDTNPTHTTFGKYRFVTSFSVPVDNTHGPGWIDLASDGKTIFYTSQGTTIRTFDTSGVNAPGVYATLPTNTTLFALRILPPGNGSGGVLVAAKSNVLLVNGASVTKFNIFGNDNDLEALTLDPSGPNLAWVGDATSNDFIRFNTATKQTVTFNTGTGTVSKLGGICVDGGFSAAELNSLQINTQPFTLTPPTQDNPTSNTLVYPSPFTGAILTATLPDLINNVTVTLHDSLVDPSIALSDPIVFSFNAGNPDFGTGTVPGNMPCDQTLTNAAGFPNTCEVFEFEANPNSGFSLPNLRMDKPPQGPGSLETTPNLRLLRNLDEDTTSGVITLPLIGKQCVITANQQTSNSNFEICGGGFSSPIKGATIVKKNTASIAFKFKVSPTGTCPNGQSPASCATAPAGATCLTPLLMIVKTFLPDPKTGITPAPVSVPVEVAGKSGGPPTFILSGNTWQLQVKTAKLDVGFTYIATMVDLVGTVQSISTTFILQ